LKVSKIALYVNVRDKSKLFVMELSKQERRLAETAEKNYHRLLYRKSELIGWIGLPVFLLGILPFISLPLWLDKSFLILGCVMMVLGCLGSAMSALGKLQKRVHVKVKVKGSSLCLTLLVF
jgi:hypothetical protein